MISHLFSIILLFLLFFAIACFSAGETSLFMSNTYRLRHLSKTSKGALRALQLLKRKDRLLGLLLLGNTFAMILIANVFSELLESFHLSPFWNFIWDTLLLTIAILILGETLPKTIATLYPETIATKTAIIFQFLLFILYPLIWMINIISNGLLKLFGLSLHKPEHHLTREELKTVVHETTNNIPNTHRDMLLGLLSLDDLEIDEIMIPRHEIIGLDLSHSLKEIVAQLASTQHTFLVIYDNELDNLIGILHTRDALNLIADDLFCVNSLITVLEKPYFIPSGTPLMTQLLHFKQHKKRFALVVNEYGDIQGLITLEDILKEVIGEFTTDLANTSKDFHPQKDGSTLVDGSLSLREVNKALNLTLESTMSTTLSGLLIDELQTIPEIGTCCLIDGIPMEVVQVFENRIKTVRIGRAVIQHQLKN